MLPLVLRDWASSLSRRRFWASPGYGLRRSSRNWASGLLRLALTYLSLFKTFIVSSCTEGFLLVRRYLPNFPSATGLRAQTVRGSVCPGLRARCRLKGKTGHFDWFFRVACGERGGNVINWMELRVVWYLHRGQWDNYPMSEQRSYLWF